MNAFLLIDDDEIFAHLMQRGFVRHGLTLDWCADAASAMDYSGHPEGIVLDLNLGGDSGLQLLPRLVNKYPQAKIVVLTGYASISTAVSAVKLGACQYLPKPTDVPTLLQAFAHSSDAIDTPTEIDTPIAEQGPSLQRLKWEHIQFVLQQNDGNISATARALNMHRRTLQRMLAKHPVKK